MQDLIGKKFRQYYRSSNMLSAWEDTVQKISHQYITFEHVQRIAGVPKRIRCQQVEIVLHGETHSCTLSGAVLV